jgi:hypothetical protein
MFDKMGNVDIAASQAEINKLDPKSDVRTQAQKQLDIVKEFKAKEMAELFKGLSDYDTYEAKRTKILRDAEVERLKIAATNLDPEVKEQLTASNKTREKEGLSKLTTEQFKGSELWQTVFGDLDKVSNESISLLKERIKEYIEIAGKDLAPTEMKEMMKTLEDLEKRTATFDLGAVFKAVFTSIDLQPLKDKVEEAKRDMETLRSIKDGAVIGKTNADNKITAMEKAGEDVTKPKEYAAALEEQANATKGLAIADANLIKAEKALAGAEKEFTTAADKKRKTLKENKIALDKDISDLSNMKAAVDGVVNAFYEVADAMGLTINPETKAILDGLTKGIGAMIAVLTAVSLILVVIDSQLAPIIAVIWPILAAMAALIAIFAIFKAIKLNGINDELKKQEAIVANLEKQYAELERAMENSLGTDWIEAYNKELVNLSQQVTSITEQIRLEKSKGKDADQSKIDELTKSLDDTNIKIVESSKRLQNFASGTDLVSAATDFASAWLDAYKSFGSTTDAMKAKFKDMINNMVVNTLLAKAMEIALKPIFTAMEKAAETTSAGGASYTYDEIAAIVAETTKSTANADANLTAIMDGLDAAGVKVRDSSTNLTGLARGISGITEDTGLLLGGYLDSIRFRMFQHFDLIEGQQKYDFGGSIDKLLALQGTQINHLLAISANTLSSAKSNADLLDKINSVMAVSTTGTGYALRVNA